MNRRFTNRLLSLLLAWWLITTLAMPLVRAAGREETVTISCAEDMEEFAKNCALDIWSQGKTFILAADLDLTGVDFAPIPTFGGTFLGQGHVISGLRITGAGSVQGLFRYVQPAGLIQDLTVKGTVAPEGTRSTTGGIVGENAGTVQNCAFQGVVRGESTVGGIAGRNSESGQIIHCTVSGTVSGENATGGIAGRNFGLLLQCENRAGVNLTRTEPSAGLTDVDAGAVLEERAAADDDAYHLLSSCSDTGGVVGRSSGVVQSCVNNGTVGYPHVGYNAGGIAGRQNGYLAGCVNNGTVHGRKDVGGIVGQAEPDLVADPGRDTLNQLRKELDNLDRLINQALDGAQRTGDSVTLRLEAMGDYTDRARDSSQRLLDRVSGFTDENIGTVNTVAADITNTLDKISPALDDLSDVGQQLEQLSDQLEDALDELDGAVDTSDQVMDSLRACVQELRQCRERLGEAAEELKQALEALRRTVFPEEGGLPVRPAPEDLEAAKEGVRRAFRKLRQAGDGLEDALNRLQGALEDASSLPGQLGDALGELKKMTNSSASIGRLLSRAFNTIGDGVDGLTAGGPAEFTPLGEEFQQASDSLYGALGGLAGEMEGLRDVLGSGGDTLTTDMRTISRQFNVVSDILLDALADLQDAGEEGVNNLIQDTSEEDIAATRKGKVADCRNTGFVEGDRNVGGVVGAMAIEFDLDPEDDTADLFNFGATYETKAVLQNCLNWGGVTAKKDCVGGLAGRMDLGTALDCQNYGPITSTGGDYVGGVVGWADASVRSCFAKNTLAGKNYIGGIAGWASRLRDCCAIATIAEGTECLGAIAGSVEAGGALRNNRFVDTGIAGVDGVSYADRAQPVPFDELAQLPDVPPEFTAFTLTLTTNGETVARIPFLYGEDLSKVELPPVPELEGCYGVWPEFDRSGTVSDLVLEAEYTPWVTVVASQELSGQLPLALAEGRFTEEAVLHVLNSEQVSPEDAVIWDISLIGTELGENDTVPLRLLRPEGGKVSVWQYQESRWQQVEAVENGRYLLLSMTGTRGTFCIQSQAGPPWMALAAGGSGAALIAIVLAAVKIQKKKKAAKAATEQGTQEEKETAAKD